MDQRDMGHPASELAVLLPANLLNGLPDVAGRDYHGGRFVRL
jgi:hypothetical protein